MPRTIGWHPWRPFGAMIESTEKRGPWLAEMTRARPARRLMAGATMVSGERTLQPGVIPGWTEL